MTQAEIKPVRVCFVCLGNICRSPTAEGVMRKLVEDRGLTHVIEIDSAGTGASHVGQPADARSAHTAKKRGVILTSRARRFGRGDFDDFDYIVAMDSTNYAHMDHLARTPDERAKLSMLRSFGPKGESIDVPDPYYDDNFDEVFDICQAGCSGLLEHIVKQHGLVP